jgi:MFS family permease
MAVLWRSWIAFTAVIAIGLCALTLLSVLQHDVILSRLIQQRLSVIAQTTASSFQSVINLGLPLSMMRNADNILNRAFEIDSAISQIHVFNPSGIIVHSTTSGIATKVSRDSLLAQSLSGSNMWNSNTEKELQAGYSIKNAAGELVGGVLVVTSAADYNAKSEAMAARILTMAVIILIAFTLLSLLVLRLKLGGAIRGMKKLDILSNKFGREDEKEIDCSTKSSTEPNFGFLSAEIAVLENQLGEAKQQYHVAHEQFENLSEFSDTTKQPGDEQVHKVAIAPVTETSFARVFARNLTPWAAALVLGSNLVLGILVYQEVNISFEPELSSRTELIGTVANQNVQRAVSAGVPLEALVGIESYFDDLLHNFPEIAYFGISTGRIVYEAGSRQKFAFAPDRSRKDVPTFPISADGQQIGYILIDASPEYFALQFRDVLLDFAVVILVVILIAFQIIVVVMSRSLTAPFMQLQYIVSLQAAGNFSKIIVVKGENAISRLSRSLSNNAETLNRLYTVLQAQMLTKGNEALLDPLKTKFNLHDGRPEILQFSFLNDVRLPLLLIAAADELPLAFFPLYTRAAENPFSWLDTGVVLSLPLAGYLLAIVCGSPFARPLADRFGHRNLLLAAALPAITGHLGLYFSTNVTEIIIFRSISGLGYAIATLACQDYVLDVTPSKDRNRSLGLFTAAMFSGIFAGAALGGVLADRLGQDTVFAISAGLVLISIMLAFRMMPARIPVDGASVSKIYLPPILPPLRSLRFFALVVGIAIPANVLMQAFISFLVSLQMDELGASAADIGRILMVCFLAVVLVGPMVPRLFSGRINASYILILGALLSSSALSVAVIWPAEWSMLVAVGGAGIGIGLIRDSQITAAIKIADDEFFQFGSNAALGSLRTLERAGSIFGLVIVAYYSSYAGYTGAILAIAIWLAVGVAFFAAVVITKDTISRSQRIAAPPQAGTD